MRSGLPWHKVSRSSGSFCIVLSPLTGSTSSYSPLPAVALFCDYKGAFSIVLMALVDVELNIFVDVGKNRRLNDSGVWMETQLWEELEAKPHYLPPLATLLHSTHFCSLYHCREEKLYLMRPYPAADLEHEKMIFNYR